MSSSSFSELDGKPDASTEDGGGAGGCGPLLGTSPNAGEEVPGGIGREFVGAVGVVVIGLVPGD